MPDNHLKISQGGFVFDIRTAPRSEWVIRALAKRWHLFLTDSDAVDVNAHIHFYEPLKAYVWTLEQVAPFSRMFREIENRFPFTSGESMPACPPEEILTRLDPEARILKQIRSGLRQHATIFFASTDSGFSVFDPKRGRLDLFTPRMSRPLPLISRLDRKCSEKKAVLWADIANGMMLAVAWLSIMNGGLLLHGTGLGRSSEAILFLGMSGAGKSTVARKCPADACFSDDGVIIKKTEGGFYLHPSVFMQSQGYWRRPLPTPMKLTRLLLLNKSDQDQTTPVDKNYLLNHILLHLIHFFRYFDRETAQRAFKTTTEMVGALPAFRFDFTKDRQEWSDVWQAPEKRKNTSHRS